MAFRFEELKVWHMAADLSNEIDFLARRFPKIELFSLTSQIKRAADSVVLNIAEPGALIGFAGPRVIKETIKKDLPPGFQRSEFILEHGFLDFIIDRKDLKEKLATVLTLFKN